MANDTVKSLSITNLDTVPVIENTAGAGAPARLVAVDDYCTATAAGLQSSGSYYKIVRVPTNALVKSVQMGADSGPNLNGSLSLSLGWVFSDATGLGIDDGTPVYLAGLVPQNTNTGGTTTIASWTDPNQIYGLWKPSASASIIEPTEFIFNGLGTDYALTGSGPGEGFMNQPLWQILGFTDGRGEPSDPGGYFDLLAYVATGATTGGACNIYAKVSYLI